ncbi:MAG: DUF6054 family protein [Eubacteriales bacterium]
MAKSEFTFLGNFNEILSAIETGILNGSVSASLEDQTNWNFENVQCAVRVFERYSMIGENRVSLSVTMVGQGDKVHLSAITSGGSQAIFFKINTLGEEAFLECVNEIARGFNEV